MGSRTVQWFFIVGGTCFLLASLYLRERPGEGPHAVASTLGLIGFFWVVPQLVILAVRALKRP